MGILDNSELVEKSPSSSGRGGSSKSKTFLSLMGVILLLALAVGGSIYVVKMKPELLGLAKTQVDNTAENQNLIKKVGKIIKLPDGELPTIATVSDLSKTQDKEFFKNAKEGDRVLVYKNAKRAYLYRPSENKVIEVGVVNINNEPQKTGEVAGQNTEIPVITPTPIPTSIPSPTTAPSVTLRPTTSLTSPTPTITLTP